MHREALDSFYGLHYNNLALKYGPVAQLARAPALHAGGQEFESPQVHQEKIPSGIFLFSFFVL